MEISQTDHVLDLVVGLARMGKFAEAHLLLQHYTRVRPTDLRGWTWFAATAPSLQDRQDALERVISSTDIYYLVTLYLQAQRGLAEAAFVSIIDGSVEKLETIARLWSESEGILNDYTYDICDLFRQIKSKNGDTARVIPFIEYFYDKWSDDHTSTSKSDFTARIMLIHNTASQGREFVAKFILHDLIKTDAEDNDFTSLLTRAIFSNDTKDIQNLANMIRNNHEYSLLIIEQMGLFLSIMLDIQNEYTDDDLQLYSETIEVVNIYSDITSLWLIVAFAAIDQSDRQAALERVITVYPDNELAAIGLTALNVPSGPASFDILQPSCGQTELKFFFDAAQASSRNEACAIYRLLVVLAPKNKDAWLNLGDTTDTVSERNAAFRNALLLDPADPDMQQELAKRGLNSTLVLVGSPRLYSHIISTRSVQCYPLIGPWARPLHWWQRIAELAPALPLGLVADLGVLLIDQQLAILDSESHTLAQRSGSEIERYGAFLRQVASSPVAKAARTLGLNDVALTALLTYMAQNAPVPLEYRLSPSELPAVVAPMIASLLTDPSAQVLDHPPLFYADTLLEHLLNRLRALRPSDIQFLHTMGVGALGVTDLADLRALTELLSLPSLTHALLDEVLAFLPALAEAPAGAASQTYAVDGFSGLARHGSLDAVLSSEWALPADLLAHRFANGELLYYGHERPPERRATVFLLLIQGGDAMTGDPDVLARASALALARTAAARGALVRAAWFDTTLHPPQGLARPREVAAFVQQQARGGVDLARVLAAVTAHVQALRQEGARVEVQWLLHAQCGADQAGAVGTLARRLRGQAGVSALFVGAGAVAEPPALAGVLAARWAALGSDVLHDLEARARAARALRGLARPGERERLATSPPPSPRRRMVAAPASSAEPARALLEEAGWDAALQELEPRARNGDEEAKRLLVEIVERAESRTPRDVGTGSPIYGAPEDALAFAELEPRVLAGNDTARQPLVKDIEGTGPLKLPPYAPLDTRLRAAAVLGAVGDPRLLDPRAGDSAVGNYWCAIDAGPFWYGDDRSKRLQQMTLPYACRIGRYPVTNAEYRRFVEAGGYQERQWWTENGWQYLQPGSQRWFESTDKRITQPHYWDNERYNQPAQPVVGVTWYEAAAYGAWLTGQGHAAGWLAADNEIRLPTSLEWERAARHTDQRCYPWGDTVPDAERANYAATRIGTPTPVGCFPAGAAPCGALDLAGNIMEWLATAEPTPQAWEPQKDFTNRTLMLVKSGGYTGSSEQIYCGARGRHYPEYRYFYLGFRVIWSRALG